MITLRCPHCKREVTACAEETDPLGTAVVETTCDRCDDGGGFPETNYYDAGGRWYAGLADWRDLSAVRSSP